MMVGRDADHRKYATDETACVWSPYSKPLQNEGVKQNHKSFPISAVV